MPFSRTSMRTTVAILLSLTGCSNGTVQAHDPLSGGNSTEHTSGSTSTALDAGVALDDPDVPDATDDVPANPRRILFSQDSPFGRVIVLEEGDLRVMRFNSPDSFDQSAISLSDPASVPVEYVRYALMGLGFVPRVQRVLMIGVGGGTFTNIVHEHLPEVLIDAVDINPVVIDAARTYFNLHDDARYRVYVRDGEAFVRESRARYDLVLVDAYAGESVPEPLATAAFFQSVKSHLTPHGIAVLNVAVQGEAERAIMEHIRAVFSTIHCFQAPVDGNVVLLAVNGTPASEVTVTQQVDALDQRFHLPFSLRSLLAHRVERSEIRCDGWQQAARHTPR